MILHSLTLSGIKGFPSSATLDVSALPSGVVALVGTNGCGKSTTLRVYRAILDRTARLDLLAQATQRNAYVRCVVDTPAGHRSITFSLDGGPTGKGGSDVTVLDREGAPAMASTSVRAYDAWSAVHLPSPDVFLSAMFAAQGESNFLDRTPADRKAVILRALGIDKLEAMATKARAEAEAVRAKIVTLDAEILTARRAAGVDAAESVVRDCQREMARCAEAVTVSGEALEHARASHAAIAAAYNDARAAKVRADAAQAAYAAAETTVRELDAAKRSHEAKLTRSEEIEAAAGSVPCLELYAEATGVELIRVTADREEARRTHSLAVRAVEECRARLTEANGRLLRSRAASAGLASAERELEALPGLREVEARAKAARDEAEQAVERAKDATHDIAGRRIGTLRDALVAIEEMPSETALTEIQTMAAEALAADDEILRGAALAPSVVAEARQASGAAGERLDVAQRSRMSSEIVAATVPGLRAMAAASAQDAEAAATAARALSDADAAAAVAAEQCRECDRVFSAASRERDAVQGKLSDARTIAAGLAGVQVAREALAQLAERRAAAVVVLEERATARDLAPPPPTMPPPPADLSAPERAVQEAEAAHRQAQQATMRAEVAVESTKVAAARVATLEQHRDAESTRLADWLRLADDVGTKGLIALLVDAAGPELSEITSALLRECYGPRWSVEFVTVRSSADGKRDIEDCILRVTDAQEAYDPRDATQFSGGQRVILGEAVSLALATIAIRRGGLTGCTLVRDESGAALDDETGPLYVAMLRRAATLAGAARVLWVTHNQALVPLCDARVRIDGGQFMTE